jgi:hypothetical protein
MEIVNSTAAEALNWEYVGIEILLLKDVFYESEINSEDWGSFRE